MNVKPSLNDGHLHTASFDMLHDVFLRFQVLGITLGITFLGRCHSGRKPIVNCIVKQCKEQWVSSQIITSFHE